MMSRQQATTVNNINNKNKNNNTFWSSTPIQLSPSTASSWGPVNSFVAGSRPNSPTSLNNSIGSGVNSFFGGAGGKSVNNKDDAAANENTCDMNVVNDYINSEIDNNYSSPRERNEANGWRLDAIARGVTNVGGAVFVASALMKQAHIAAGCGGDDDNEYSSYDANMDGYVDYENIDYYEIDNEDDDRGNNGECNGRVYGVKPSSLLADIVFIVCLLSAILMPLVGSIIDHTSYRRLLARITAIVMIICILLQLIMMENYWFVAVICQIVLAFSYLVHLCTVYAYLPELTTCKEKTVTYTSQFVAIQFFSSVTFLIVMVGVLSLFSSLGDGDGPDEIQSAQISQSVVIIICIICYSYAWLVLFQERMPSHPIPKNATLLSAGFRRLYHTGETIINNHIAIKWFLLSACFTEAALTAFSSIAITYMTEQLNFTSKQNGLAILLLQICAVPGARIAAVFSNKYNPVLSLQVCLIGWIITISIGPYIMSSLSDARPVAYVFACIWGFLLGWVYPTEKALYCTIIPKGQEAELMGMYICSCQILGWLPPLIFSIMNESGINMNIGLFSLNIYFVISFIILYYFMGNYDDAVQHAIDFDTEEDDKLLEKEFEAGSFACGLTIATTKSFTTLYSGGGNEDSRYTTKGGHNDDDDNSLRYVNSIINIVGKHKHFLHERCPSSGNLDVASVASALTYDNNNINNQENNNNHYDRHSSSISNISCIDNSNNVTTTKETQENDREEYKEEVEDREKLEHDYHELT